MPNLPLEPVAKPSAFRKISIGTWSHPRDPTVYGAITLRMDEALRYRDAFREATGRRLTLTHMVARAVGAVLEEVPEVNALLRWGKPYLRKDHRVFFQVAMKDPETGRIDLSGHTVDRAHQRDLLDILVDFETSVERIRGAKDEKLESTRGTMKKLPGWVVGRLLDTLAFLMYTLNLDLEPMGIPSKTFGGAAVTNVGALGIEEAYVPLVGYSRTPLFVALGAVIRSPVVEPDGTLAVGQTMKVMASFDHRLIDGAHAAKMCKVLRRWMEDPWTHFGAIPESGDAHSEVAPSEPVEAPRAEVG